MHRSRLTQVLVDVPADLYEVATGFWSGALAADATGDDDDPEYRELGQVIPGLGFMVQRVGATARLHIDIESDDVDAEVARLEALGATRVEQNHTWWVMSDPAGLLFCVVRVQNREAFERDARTWP
ncbi:MAG TPA: VOC family protein [Acidimicrobiales bacterium]|jgi:hypothetical protein|nr:VOC family protein [Acidimicrobiales bacterium]